MKYSDSNLPCICMQTNSTCYKQTRTMQIKGILWHCTGANNPNLKRYVQPSKNDANYDYLIDYLGVNNNGNDYNHASYQSGLNAWIGKTAKGNVAAVQTMPWDYRPWGCGSGSKGSCNNTHLQFELCEDALTDANYFNEIYKEACELTAYLCKKYNLDPHGYTTCNGVKVPVILCHWDSYKLGLGTSHSDIYNWFDRYGKSMGDVRNDVAALLNNTAKIETNKVNYQVEVTADTLNCRAGYGTEYSIITTYAKGTILNISEEYNGWGYTGTGWISLSYTRKIATTEQPKEEEEIVTQEQFNAMMNVWIADSANKAPGDWSAEARNWAVSENLVRGDEQGRYMWEKVMTREEFVTVLSRIFNVDDSEVGDWSAEARDWAESTQLVVGDGNKKGWMDYLTKEQLVTILYRFKETIKNEK